MASVARFDPIAAPPPPQSAGLPPRAKDEEPLYEVVNGKRVELPPVSIYANWIASRLDQRLGPFAEAHGLGMVVVEGLFILDPIRDLRRRPDVAFVCAAKWPLDRELPPAGDWEIVPDLAVEVVSPNDLAQEVHAKLEEYFSFGVRQVWIVYPVDRKVYVFDSPTRVVGLAENEELDGGDLLPGFRLPLATLFQRQTAPVPPVS